MRSPVPKTRSNVRVISLASFEKNQLIYDIDSNSSIVDRTNLIRTAFEALLSIGYTLGNDTYEEVRAVAVSLYSGEWP